jgi:hypothetical protein
MNLPVYKKIFFDISYPLPPEIGRIIRDKNVSIYQVFGVV